MQNRKGIERFRAISFLILGLLLNPGLGVAHPMGNFSINHYSNIKITANWVEVRYLVDEAEIPTFQEMRQFDFVASSDDVRASRYLEEQAQRLRAGIALESDGQPIQLEAISRQVAFADGAGGLPTMKITLVFRGWALSSESKIAGSARAHKLTYLDSNFPGRAGWKEIVVIADGVNIVNSSAPSTDRSQELTNYSSDPLNSPPQQLSAEVDFDTVPVSLPLARHASKPKLQPEELVSTPVTRTFSKAPVAPIVTPLPTKPHTQNTPRSRFTQLVASHGKLSLWMLLSAALISAALGALHALEPGHGKTIVAAYLIGSRGTAKHAVLLGIVVTASHTAGVYLLGVATLYASQYIVPEQLYPWLGAISGLSVAGLGVFLFLRHATGQTAEHSHAPGERHSHWFLSMFKQTALADEGCAEPNKVEHALSLRELCMLGVTGGIVPCPAALVVLLSAFSLHRIGFGLFLITAFSFGLAAVLVIVGLTVVYAKRAMSSRVRTGHPALRYLPFLSSAFMIVLGAGITISAMSSVQIGHGLIQTERLVPFVTVVVIGLFLGMRHSTDPDHVVAVSTIVSRQGTVRSSMAIGLLWGIGHTLTIFLVGSAIIIFGVVIPPRLGLSMEFCVALMLILLGALNLTGILDWITARMTPAKRVVLITPLPTTSRRQFLPHGVLGKLGLYQTVRPLAVGLVHGLAGSAAVALLVLSTIKSPLWSTAYLLVFGFGTIAGMMMMTTAMSMPLIYTGKKFTKVNRYLILSSGLASMVFGMFLVYQIGFVDGLFKSQVHWVPQ